MMSILSSCSVHVWQCNFVSVEHEKQEYDTHSGIPLSSEDQLFQPLTGARFDDGATSVCARMLHVNDPSLTLKPRDDKPFVALHRSFGAKFTWTYYRILLQAVATGHNRELFDRFCTLSTQGQPCIMTTGFTASFLRFKSTLERQVITREYLAAQEIVQIAQTCCFGQYDVGKITSMGNG